jgi:hypothetical protein
VSRARGGHFPCGADAPERDAAVGEDARYMDDGAAAGGKERGHLVLHRVEQAGEVHVDHLVPFVDAQVRDGFEVAAHAGVVDAVMQGAELRDGVIDRPLDVGWPADVAGDGQRAATLVG